MVAVVLGRFLLPRTRVRDGASRGPRRHALRAIHRITGVPSSLAGALLAYLMLFGPIVLVPAVLQAHGASALHAGLIVAALPVAFAVSATAADRVLPAGWTARTRCALGLGVAALGLLGLVLVGTEAGGIAVALAAIGLGLGVYTPANNALIMSSVPSSAAALAGGLVNTARAVGTAAGTAIVAVAFTATGAARVPVALLLAVAALAVTTLLSRAPSNPTSGSPR